jgi:hypothetical protein
MLAPFLMDLPKTCLTLKATYVLAPSHDAPLSAPTVMLLTLFMQGGTPNLVSLLVMKWKDKHPCFHDNEREDRIGVW